GAGQEAEQDKACRIPRQAGCGGRRQINRGRDGEKPFSAEPVGQPAKKESADDGAPEKAASRKAELRLTPNQRRALFEFAGKGARQRHFETVENPGDAESNDHQEVKSAEGEGVESCRDVGFDDAAGCWRCCGSGSNSVPAR